MRKKTNNKTPRKSEAIITVTTAAMVILAIAGFIVPPTGVIDGSVLHAMALLCIPKIVTEIRVAVEQGRSFNLRHGQTSVTISDNHKQEDDE